MSTKLRKLTFPLGAILFHLLLVLWQGYFLSTEFTLYPYLSQGGLKPYSNIIDQPLPALFFGPFTLPAWLTVNPQPLLFLFLLVLALTDLFFYFYLIRTKCRHRRRLLSLFILASLFFSGNVLWIETFVVFFLSIILNLSFSKKPLSLLSMGFIFSIALFLRPTLLPAFIVLYFLLKIKPDRYFFTGLFLPPLITLLYLLRFNLLEPFLNIFFTFNTSVYASQAARLPSSRELIYVLGFLFTLLIKRWNKSDRVLTYLLILFSLLPLYPRFELIHFLPTIFLSCYLLSRHRRPINMVSYLLLLFFLFAVVYKADKYDYGNFYLTPEVKMVAEAVEDFPGEQVYVLGGSDLIYPLSHRYPTSYLYLPSLPWYLENPRFNDLQLSALKLNSSAPVVINTQSRVGNQSVMESAGPVFEYIQQNYTIIDIIGPYQIMIHQPLALNL